MPYGEDSGKFLGFELVYKLIKVLVGKLEPKPCFNFRFYFCSGSMIVYLILSAAWLFEDHDLMKKTELAKFTLTLVSILHQHLVYQRKLRPLHQFSDLSKESFTYILSKQKLFSPTLNSEIESLNLKNQKKVTTWNKFWYFATSCSYITLILGPFLSGRDPLEECYFRLPMRLWNPFGCDTIEKFSYMYIFEVLTLFIFALTFYVAASFRSTFPLIVGLQCDCLQLFLGQIARSDEKRSPSSQRVKDPLRIRVCVKIHQFLEQQIIVIDDITSEQFVVETVSYTISVCLTVFQAVTIRNSLAEISTISAYAVCLLMNFFAQCNMGTELHEKMTSIGDQCYTSQWQNLRYEDRKLLSFIIHKSQLSRHVRGMKNFDASRKSFDQMIRNIYSLLLFLLNTQTVKKKI